MLLVGDNLTGHYSVEVVRGLFAHGIMPLYTPRGGSGLNMASIRRRRRRSSPGWRRQPVAGIGSPGRSSGAANARPDEHGLARAARVSVAQVPGRGDRSPDQGRPEPMGVSKPIDPLVRRKSTDPNVRISTEHEAIDLLHRPAGEYDDTVANRVGYVAFERGWDEALDQYVIAYPDAATALAKLVAIRNALDNQTNVLPQSLKKSFASPSGTGSPS